MSSANALQTIVGGIGDFYAWVADRLNDDATRAEVLIDLGLPPNIAVGQPLPQHTLKGINDYRTSISIETEVSTAAAHDLGKVLGLSSSKSAKLVLPEKNLTGIKTFKEASDPSFSDFSKALADVKELFSALANFIKALDVEGVHDKGELAHRLIDLLLVDYLRVHYPLVYWLAQPIGFLEESVTVHNVPKVVWGQIVSLFKKRSWLIDDEAQARAISDRFFLPLSAASVIFLTKSTQRADDGDLSTLSFEPLYGWDPSPGSNTPLADKISERTLSFRISWKEENPGPPRKASEKHTTATLLFVPKIHGGPGLLISFEGGFTFDIPISEDWRFKFKADLSGVADFFVHLNEFSQSSILGPSADSRPSISIAFEGGTREQPLYRLGKEDGSHLQFGKAAIELELARGSSGIKLLSRESELVLDFGTSGNGFLSQILPDKKTIPLNLGLGWSFQRGFYLEDGKGNVSNQSAPPALRSMPQALRALGAEPPDTTPDSELNRLTPVGKSFGPARIQFLSLDLAPQSDNGKARVALAATITLDVTLGPLTATMDKTGFIISADFAKADANLSFVDLDFGFKPPEGIGLAIDAKVVHGGGFLRLDPAHSQYSGAVHLEIEGGIAVSALGLLNTNIPGGGFSFLVIITADGFRPIPIGFGFMLSAIGGLLGVHRTVNEDAVQAGVRNNTLKAVLAPTDLIRNAPQYLSTIGSIFPVARDHFLFGPVVQITWGTPALVTINLALIFEFGARTRFLVLGQLLAILPKKDLDLVRLQMNIAGGVDFDQKRAFLDAVLFDSRLVNRFIIMGEMRMRLNWGNQPFFALSVGGLHPAFNPPPGLEGMQRAAIVFADSDDLKIRCDSYFAITSNTVQFGAHAELFAKKSKFSVSGQAGFDVLIQFDPFHFVASLHASLQLKCFSRNLFKVTFDGELSGPRPLHVKGKASFEIWWVDFSVSFSTTLVSGEAPPLPAPVDVGALLRTALADPASWNAALPNSAERLVSFRERATTAMRIHPLSSLTVKQSVVPLNLRITRFGNTRPAGGPQEFHIQHILIGTQSFDPTVVLDNFAPAQFRDMSDDEKLSSPSFELLAAGVSVGANAADCGVAVVAAADYEEIIIPSPPETPRGKYLVDSLIATRLAIWSAVGLNDAGRLGANRYRAPAIPAAVPAKTYTVTSKVDLAPLTATATFTSRIEASDALRKVAVAGQAAAFQIVTTKT